METAVKVDEIAIYLPAIIYALCIAVVVFSIWKLCRVWKDYDKRLEKFSKKLELSEKEYQEDQEYIENMIKQGYSSEEIIKELHQYILSKSLKK